MNLHERPSAGHATAGLSGHVVGRLGTGEQLVLWALRQRLRDGEPASPVLVRGCRLGFGLAGLEPALAAFEDLFRTLDERAAGPDPWLLPLRCACVSAGERTVLALVASAQAGEGAWLAVRAGALAGAAGAAGVAAATLAFARALREAGLVLPPLAEAPGPVRAALTRDRPRPSAASPGGCRIRPRTCPGRGR